MESEIELRAQIGMGAGTRQAGMPHMDGGWK